MIKVLMAIGITMALVGCGTTTRAQVYTEPETPEEQEQRVMAAVEAARAGTDRAPGTDAAIVEGVIAAEKAGKPQYVDIPPDETWWQYLIVAILAPAAVAIISEVIEHHLEVNKPKPAS